MKNSLKYLGIVGLVILFGLRVHFAFKKREDQKKQAALIESLSRMQLEERMKEVNKVVVSEMDKAKLELTKQKMDSLGLKLKENQETFNKSMEKTNKKIDIPEKGN